MAEYHRDADATVRTVNKAYNKAQKDMTTEAEKIFNKFAKDGNLSPEEARKMLNEPISKAEWNEIKAKIKDIKDPKIKRQMLNRLNAPAYSARITRLEALKENTYLQSKIIADAEIRATTSGHIGTINDAYYRTMFDLQQGIGIGFDFGTMPTNRIEAILKNPWSGENFSSLVWSNTDVLAEKLTEVIAGGFMSGAGISKMAQELEHMTDMGKLAAHRLVRTETTYMANAAEIAAYEEAEVDEYMFIATLDLKTSKLCQDEDRRIHKTKDAKAGVNLPPLHPFCRSTTRAYFGAEFHSNIQRRARDPVTGKTELVSADMTYKQWLKSMEDKYGIEKLKTAEIDRKIAKSTPKKKKSKEEMNKRFVKVRDKK